MFQITAANEADIDAVLHLAETSGLSPWGCDDYAQAVFSKDRLLLVARNDSDEVFGFIFVQLLRPSAETVDLEILNIAVDPSLKRTGTGRCLVAAALENSGIGSESKVLLEVRASNHSAIGFYNHLGFHEQAIRRSYYSDPAEDAILFGANADEVRSRLNSVSPHN